MIKKKNGFFTFLFSLIPGAGEMYLGFMKEGMGIMATAFGLLMLSSWSGLDLFIYLMPLIWFYSFFNVHNKVSLSDEEFYALEDHYPFRLNQLLPKENLNGRQTKIFGWLLILFGIMIIWRPAIQSFLEAVRVYISDELADVVGNFLYRAPQYIIAVILIVCGIRLIRNKKKELDEE